MFSGTAQVSHQVCQFFISPVCLLVCATIGDKKQGCLLQFASHIGHNAIRKEEKKA
jgi:hypothetical protein